MKTMKSKFLPFCLIAIIALTAFQTNEEADYISYHQKISEAERLLSEEEFRSALIRYEQVIKQYEFVIVVIGGQTFTIDFDKVFS